MSVSHTQRTLALAGLFQTARLVQQLAREGRADAQAFTASIQSVLAIDAPSIEAVYGGVAGLRTGLELLRHKLAGSELGPPQAGPSRNRGEREPPGRGEHEFAGGSAPGDVEIVKYVLSMIQLERRLRRQPDMQEAIRRGIEAAQSQMKFFQPEDNGGAHPRLVEKLAELYTQTLSTLAPRIMVNGDHGYLGNPQNAAKVRAALFAGIRSAFLWRQLGGNRWQLLLGRKRIAAEAARILADLRAARIATAD
ncbi:MAG TPA: lysogenization regulator HflD [Candidatus Methylomirabilis sp.]|nr:lysogenization regulator HflD [Candidatus Methylomirabilis sp.]